MASASPHRPQTQPGQDRRVWILFKPKGRVLLHIDRRPTRAKTDGCEYCQTKMASASPHRPLAPRPQVDNRGTTIRAGSGRHSDNHRQRGVQTCTPRKALRHCGLRNFCEGLRRHWDPPSYRGLGFWGSYSNQNPKSDPRLTVISPEKVPTESVPSLYGGQWKVKVTYDGLVELLCGT